MKVIFAALTIFMMISPCFGADDSKPVDFIIGLTPITDAQLRPVDQRNATLSGLGGAQQLLKTVFEIAHEEFPTKEFSCIIHVVKWATDRDANPVVAKSNWYVFNSRDGWTNDDFRTNKRLFGIDRPYALLVHLNVPSTSGEDYKLAYTYSVKHRLPANVQDLRDAISLYQGSPASLRASEPRNYCALGRLEGNPPSDITIVAAVANQEGKTTNFESVAPKFDNEGLYRWDISIGVPILSHKQIQDVATTSGQETLASVDKRNVLIIGNWFIKPVDVKSTTFLTVPHLVGGISTASKPLHTAMAGIGWGPALANFYVGVLILTDNVENHKTSHHYKLAFGLNVPLRSVASKLGLKSQIE